MRRGFCIGRIQRGTALAVALVVIVVLLTLTIALITQSLASQGLQKRVEYRRYYVDAADVVKGRFMDLIAAGDSPGADRLAALGLGALPPPPGGKIAEFSGTVDSIRFYGSFNGGGEPWSTYQGIPSGVDPQDDKFSSTVPSFDPQNLPAPPQHSIIFVRAQAPGEPSRRFFFVISSLFPYGALAPSGNITLGEVTSVTEPWENEGRSEHGGMRVYVGAGQKIRIAGALEGVAQSGEAYRSDRDPVDVGKPGMHITEAGSTFFKCTGSLQALHNDIEALWAGEQQNAQDMGFGQFAGALTSAGSLFNGYSLVNMGGYGFNQSSNTMMWKDSFNVPGRSSLLVPDSLTIEGDLLLNDESTMVVNGDLMVNGHLFLGEKSALSVKGSLTCKDSVEVSYSPLSIPGINAALISGGSMELQNALRHLNFKPSAQGGSWPFGLYDNPFKDLYSLDPKKYAALFNAYLNAQQAAFSGLSSMMSPMSRFLCQKIDIPAGSEDRKIPGLLFLSMGGRVKICDNGSEAWTAGAVIAREGIVLQNGPGGIFTGILLTYGGDISAPNTTLRYYPYFSHGMIPIAPEKSFFLKVTQPYVLSSGEYIQ